MYTANDSAAVPGSAGPDSPTDPRSRIAWIVAATYLVATWPLVGRFKFSLYEDATSYLSIAQAYARGEVWNAVNGYWAPLYCWLLAPLLGLGIDPLLAPKVLGLLIGLFTIAGLSRLGRALRLPSSLHGPMLLAALPWLTYWSVSYVTPDFLLVGVLTWYLSVVYDRSPAPTARAGLATGACGGVAYLAKQYAMPFVLSHLALTALLQWREHRVFPARWALSAAAAFLVVCMPWIAAMSAKYDRLTIAASGTYNWYLHGPGVGGQFNVGTQGLASPPFPGAVSAWVDPTMYVPGHAWEVGSTREAVLIKVQQILDATLLAATTLEKFSVLAMPLLAVGLLSAARPKRGEDLRLGWLAATTLLFLSGYILIADEILERLVWIVVILLIVLAFTLMHRAGVQGGRLFRSRFAVVLVVASFWLLPVRRIAQEIDEGRQLHALAMELQDHGLRGRIATLNRYADSLRVAFFTRTTFYGRVSQRASAEEVLADLRAHEIEYLLIWTTGESPGDGRIAQALQRRFPHRVVGDGEVRVLDLTGLHSGIDRRGAPPDDPASRIVSRR